MMINHQLRTASAADFDAILRMNAAVVKWTSPLDRSRLAQLHAWSNHHKVITINGSIAAFLLVMPAGTTYDSDNYLWFSARYENFWYVDRIVVDADFVGMQLGGQLYCDLFETANHQGIPLITCEYNIEPMNYASERFHRRFGFRQVSTQWLENKTKQVSLQIAEVTATAEVKT